MHTRKDATQRLDNNVSALVEIQTTHTVAKGGAAGSKTHGRNLRLHCFVQSGARLACDVCPACGKGSETQDHMRRCQEQPDVVVRKDS